MDSESIDSFPISSNAPPAPAPPPVRRKLSLPPPLPSLFASPLSESVSQWSAERQRFASVSRVEHVSSFEHTMLSFGACANIGFYRSAMEDAFDFIPERAGTGAVFSCAVYDGHGGCAMAKELLDRRGIIAPMHDSVDAAAAASAAETSFVRVGTSLPAALSTNCGTTASVCSLFVRDDGGFDVVCANVGDSEVGIVRIGGEIEMLSTVHKIANDSERQRLEESHIPIFGDRVFGVLNITRAVGDSNLWSKDGAEGVVGKVETPTRFPPSPRELKQITPATGVIPNPSVATVAIQEGEFLLLASDGFWDVYPSNDSRRELAKTISEAFAKGTPLLQLSNTLVVSACASSLDNVTLAIVAISAHPVASTGRVEDVLAVEDV